MCQLLVELYLCEVLQLEFCDTRVRRLFNYKIRSTKVLMKS